MRAGIQRLASIVSTDFGEDPQDGALYCFVSRDCLKMKMLRFDVNGWVLYYCYLAEGTFRWEHRPDYADSKLTFERRKLMWLLDGLAKAGLREPQAPPPVTANIILWNSGKTQVRCGFCHLCRIIYACKRPPT